MVPHQASAEDDHLLPVFSIRRVGDVPVKQALTSVARWGGHCTANWKVATPIPGQGACLPGLRARTLVEGE